jgi:hypothetical protein
MLRLPLSVLALAVAGCDTAEEDVAGPVEGPLVVSVVRLDASATGSDRTLLQIETEEEYHCLLPLAVRYDRERRTLRAGVRGIAETDACFTAIGPASARLPLDLRDGAYTLELHHLGETDLYALVVVEGVVRAEAVRTEVSRLGPR